MNTVLNRVQVLMNSKNAETDWQMLLWLQREQAPWLSEKEVEDCVIYSLVKLHGDYELSWLWYNEHTQYQEQSIAA